MTITSIPCYNVDHEKVRNANIIFRRVEYINPKGMIGWHWHLELSIEPNTIEVIIPIVPDNSRGPFSTRAEALQRALEVLDPENVRHQEQEAVYLKR